MPKNEAPTAQEFGQLISWLAIRGVNASSVIGNAPAGRTREQIANELTAWFKVSVKA